MCPWLVLIQGNHHPILKWIKQSSPRNSWTEAEHLVTVKDPLSKSKGPQSDLLDLSKEGDDEAVRSTNAINSSDSSEKRKIACPLVWIVEPMQPVEESNQISSYFESAVKLAAQMELRRSTRNIACNFPAKTINYADYVPRRKSSISKKKPAFEDEVVLQASLTVLFLLKNWNKYYLGGI